MNYKVFKLLRDFGDLDFMVSNLGLLNSDSKSLSFDGDPMYSVWFFRLEAALNVATARFV